MSGKLTAEQVRDAVYKNSTYNDIYMVYQVSRTDMQAIADELNATLGGNKNRISERLRGVASDMRNIGASSMTPHELFAYWAREVDKAADLAAVLGGGECEITGSSTNGLMYPDYMTKWYELSCGHSVTLKGSEPPRFCPKCGKAVKQ